MQTGQHIGQGRTSCVVEVESQLIPLKSEWLKLAQRVGELFGLDIYGLDVLETNNGPVVVDINDFPSFGQVPGAVKRISNYILRLAKDAKFKRYRLPDRGTFHTVRAQRLVMAR